MSWRERAKCASSEEIYELDSTLVHDKAEVFFPLPGEREKAERAKGICAHCPVAAQCLEEALRLGLDDGIWGGLAPEERRGLRAADAEGITA